MRRYLTIRTMMKRKLQKKIPFESISKNTYSGYWDMPKLRLRTNKRSQNHGYHGGYNPYRWKAKFLSALIRNVSDFAEYIWLGSVLWMFLTSEKRTWGSR